MKNIKIYQGSIEAFILQLLSKNGRMYGYELSKSILQITENKLDVPESKLYGVLHSMEADGYLESEIEVVENRLRKYYKLTTNGEKEAASNLDFLQEFVKHLNNLLNIQTV